MCYNEDIYLKYIHKKGAGFMSRPRYGNIDPNSYQPRSGSGWFAKTLLLILVAAMGTVIYLQATGRLDIQAIITGAPTYRYDQSGSWDTSPFQDLDGRQYAAIKKVLDAKVMLPKANGLFGTDDTLRGHQFATLLFRLGKRLNKEPKFLELNSDEQVQVEVAKRLLSEFGPLAIFDGDPTGDTGNITRFQIATMIVPLL